MNQYNTFPYSGLGWMIWLCFFSLFLMGGKVQVEVDSQGIDERLTSLDHSYQRTFFIQGDSALLWVEEGYRLAQEADLLKWQGRFLGRKTVLQLNQDQSMDVRSQLELARRISRENQDVVGEVEALNYLSEYYNRQGDYQEAEQLTKAAITLNPQKTIWDTQQLILSHLISGESLYYQGQYSEARKTIDQAVRMSEEINFYYGLAVAFNDLNNISKHIGDYQSALRYLEESHQLSKTHLDGAGMAHILSNMGDIHERQGRLNEAVHYFKQAIHRARPGIDQSILISTRSRLSRVYRQQGDYVMAHQELQACMQLAEEGGVEKAALARVNCELGNLYAQIGLDSLAYVHIKESLQLSVNSQHASNTAMAYYSLGELCWLQKDWDAALMAFQNGLNIAQKDGDEELIAQGNLGLGKAMFQLNQLEKSSDYLEEVLRISHRLGSTTELIETYAFLGAIHNEIEQPTPALQYCGEGYDMALETGITRLQLLNCQCLGVAHRKLENYEDALLYLDREKSLKDQLDKATAIKEIGARQLALEVERVNLEKSMQNALLAAENELQSQKMHSQQIRILLLLSLVLVMALIGFLFYRSNRTRKKHNRALAQLNSELNTANDRLGTQNVELGLLNNQLQETNQALNNFAAVAAHDLKAPLRTIGSFTQLLQRRLQSKMEADEKDYFQFIAQSSRRLSQMIDDLLSFSRLGKGMPAASPVNLNDVLPIVAANLQATLTKESGQLEIGPLPTVLGHESLMTQLFQNLINNSLKFRKADEAPHVKVYQVPHQPASVVHLVVEDNGLGVAKDQHEAVFELFNRLNSKEEYEGSGVGLATCKKIIQHYGGKIWLESEEGVGTQVHLKLKASK